MKSLKNTFLKYLAIFCAAAAIFALCGFAFGIFERKDEKDDSSDSAPVVEVDPYDDPNNWVRLPENGAQLKSEDIVSGGLYKLVVANIEVQEDISLLSSAGIYYSSDPSELVDSLQFCKIDVSNSVPGDEIYFTCPNFVFAEGSGLAEGSDNGFPLPEIYRYIG